MAQIMSRGHSSCMRVTHVIRHRLNQTHVTQLHPLAYRICSRIRSPRSTLLDTSHPISTSHRHLMVTSHRVAHSRSTLLRRSSDPPHAQQIDSAARAHQAMFRSPATVGARRIAWHAHLISLIACSSCSDEMKGRTRSSAHTGTARATPTAKRRRVEQISKAGKNSKVSRRRQAYASTQDACVAFTSRAIPLCTG